MATNLNQRIGEMNFDGLFTDITPPAQVRGGTINRLTEATTYKRGTILAKSANSGKLYILGSVAAEGDTLTADCILCDDTDIGATADAAAIVYTAGCFDPGKVIVADGHTITEAEKDKLRERGIVFKAAYTD